jgi:hypothetical protein
MEKQVVEMIKTRLFQAAFGKMGPKYGGKLPFIQDIHTGQLIQAVQYLGGGDAHALPHGRMRRI